MAITAGSEILASDFIDTSAGAGDAGKGVKLNASGQISKTMTPDWRTTTTTSSATPTINTDSYDRLTLTAQAVDITSMTTNLSGTPIDGQKLQVRITPTARSGGLTYVASSTTNNSSTTITINKPTGTVDGDIMFAVITRITGGTFPSGVPSGWTLLKQRSASNAWALYYKIAASEGASYVWTYDASVNLDGHIFTYRGGFNPTNPIELDSISDTQYQTSDTTVRAASVGIIKANSPLIFIGMYNDTGITFTKPSVPTSGWVEDFDSAGSMASSRHEVCSFVWSGSGETGNVDATVSSNTTTVKHAFMVALNPEIDVTWGASYSEIGNDLPTKLYGPNATTIDFQYNSANSKWETIGEDNSRWQNTAIGTTTKDMSATTDTTIAHGLGKKPKKVKLTAVLSSSSSMSYSKAILATFNNTRTQVSAYVYADTSSGTGEGAGTTFRISVDTTNYQEGLIYADTTNIKIIWTKTSSPTGTASLMWEAEI